MPLQYIPETITVHLGPPSSDAPNVTVPFADYIKNVASSEIYPTWPENAIRANILAQITFALNRIYTEWYRSRGYDFDITNSTSYDQAYVPGRDIFESISQIVDEIFNNYVRRDGYDEPLFTQFCNGTTVTCDGLSQWGTVELANRGYSPLNILKYYYGDDIHIVEDTPVGRLRESYPGFPLRRGDTLNEVEALQRKLNRISQNYPLIPKINPVNAVFDKNTEDAVKKFQEIFNLTVDGIVGKSTWYKINRIYTAVTKLAELDSEGVRLQDVSKRYSDVIKQGMTGLEVEVLQYYLNVLAINDPSLPSAAIDGVFGPATAEAVKAFQRKNNLTPDGIVGRQTWQALTAAYLGAVRALPQLLPQFNAPVYPGHVLVVGDRGDSVSIMQQYLSDISAKVPSIPNIKPDGIYGPATQRAVNAFQKYMGFEQTGSIGLKTWKAIVEKRRELYE